MALNKDRFKSIVTQSKVNVRIDMKKELEGLSASQKRELKSIVGTTFISEIEKSTMKKTSTVNQSGSNAFKKLEKLYRKKKMAMGKGGQPNLHLKNQMIKDIFSNTNVSNGVSLNITEKLSMKKAENHNHGVTLPKRQFLPTKDAQGFRQDIMRVVNKKIRDYKKNIVKT